MAFDDNDMDSIPFYSDLVLFFNEYFHLKCNLISEFFAHVSLGKLYFLLYSGLLIILSGLDLFIANKT